MESNRIEEVVEDLPCFYSITPIQKSVDLSNYTGANVYIKREDQQDHVGSGVKIRQINQLLHAASRENDVQVIIDGVPQSNCLAAISHYADQYDIPLHILLKCAETDDMSGNLGNIRRSRAKITWVPELSALEEVRHRVEAHYKAKGYTLLSVPTGANCCLTVEGPIGMGCEIAEQEQQMGVKFKQIVLPVGTGGTMSGLVLSKVWHHREWQVLGVRIDEYPDSFYQANYATRISHLGLKADELSHLPDCIELYDGALQGGYGHYTKNDLVEIEQIYKQTGIYFGPTYTFKAVKGLKQMVAEGLICPNEPTLLIHTGGVNERAHV